MRYYILDDVVDPLTGETLRVENAVVATQPGLPVAPCTRWCGRRGRPVSDLEAGECCVCGDEWVVSGELVSAHSRYPIVDGIPRLLPEAAVEAVASDAMSAKIQETFGYEWEHFDAMLPEYEAAVRTYFKPVPDQLLEGALVLDAGCGMGRWARYVGEQPIRRLYAIDFSRAIDRAATTLRGWDNTHCIQADIRHLPFRPQTFDFIYSLGVLHHLVNPDEGMGSLVGRLKSDGALLVYLYYALDNRPAFFRWLLRAVTAVRQITSRLPKPIMHRLAMLIAIGVYWPLARTAGGLERLGLSRIARQMPLHEYHRYSFSYMRTDAFDRFATPIEKRYSRKQIRVWLARYGLEPTFSDVAPFWSVLARRPR